MNKKREMTFWGFCTRLLYCVFAAIVGLFVMCAVAGPDQTLLCVQTVEQIVGNVAGALVLVAIMLVCMLVLMLST